MQRQRVAVYALMAGVGNDRVWRIACTLARMRIKGRTATVVESARNTLSVLVQLSAGMSGLFLTGLTRLRVGVSAASVLVWLALAAAGFHPSLELALVLFGALYIVRYSF